MKINERLKKIRESKKMNQAEFAKLLGMGQSTLGMMEVGKREILDRHIKTICSICHINESWLRDGTGDMYQGSGSFSLDEYAQEHHLSCLEIDIIRCYMELAPDIRKTILQHFKTVFLAHSQEISDELNIDREVEDYRRELEAEKNPQKSSGASQSTGASA